jgi:NTE family protein
MARVAFDPILRDLYPFTDCDPRERRVLAPLVTTVEVPAGHTLLRQGDDGNEMMIIAAGTATVLRDDQPIAELSRGDVVGEMSILVDAPRNATVVATSAMTLAVLAPGSFAVVLDECPTLANAVMRTAIRRLATAA